MADQIAMSTTVSQTLPTPAPALTSALVRQVAEKVYALWLRDLQLERERAGVHRLQKQHPGGRRWQPT